jgi:lipopolysaccharide/colanic/teichoic acid biosynthesis glycosyltransferase
LKRGLDLVGASLVLAFSIPVLVAAAVAIKLEDRGPIFFRQQRIGHKGTTFEIIKLRTMVPDASTRVAELVTLNERTGPLFKLGHDPRVTRVGHFLRGTSIDELPQLINVVRGEMSLVGPRPALPEEVEQFDVELMERASVPPGITGLWQVSGRDNPSFQAYKRLDLFYVDNWSVMMDLTVLLSTAIVVIGRAIRTLRGGSEMVKSRHADRIVTPAQTDHRPSRARRISLRRASTGLSTSSQFQQRHPSGQEAT